MAKVLNITDHQGNANENHSEIAVHTSHTAHVRRMAIIKKTRDNKCWGREKGTLACTLLVTMSTGITSREPVWRFFKKLKIGLPYDPAIPLWVFIQRN